MSMFGKKQNTQTKKNDGDKTIEKVSMKDLYESGQKNVTPTSKKEERAVGHVKYVEAYRVLVKPLVTEKAAKLGAFNKYAFMVARSANKIMVGRAIEQIYGIKPKAVNIVAMEGKPVRNRQSFGKRKDWKKAIVSLPKGKNINIYEGV